MRQAASTAEQAAHEMSEIAEYKAKRLAFYEACLAGWLQTTFEKDKSILSISSGAIAIVFGVIFQFGDKIPLVSVSAYLVSGFSFAIAISLCILIFSKNAAIFEAAINGGQLSLRVYDHLLNAAFLMGMAALLIGGSAEAIQLVSQRTEKSMPEPPSRHVVGDSASGLPRLAPKPPSTTQKAPSPPPTRPKGK